jgi:hypothetical protein
MPVSVPFYIQITNVKEDYINSQGKPQSVDLPLVTLPAGTLLFRGLKIPNPTKGEDIRYFYRDFLGTPEGHENVCLSPTHNVFFYPFPYVAFGVHEVGKTYTMMQAVVLVNPVTVVACISPSPFARGKANVYSGTAPWQRCDSFSGPEYDCHPETPKEKVEKYYDNCLHPEYQLRSSTRGWIAIANQDSIRPKDKSKYNKDKSKNTQISISSSMAPFLRSLNAQIPGEGKKALAWTYTDDSKKAGFPEIALYPYRKHKGKRPFQRECPTNAAAMKLLEREAANNNLNYLPIAAFTKEGTVDMVNGHFSYDRLSIKPNSFNTVSAQQAILNHVHTFMQGMKTDGIDLPYYGKCKLTFDSRTGFFALDKVVPKSLQIQTSLYRSLLMPLNTKQAEERAMRYMLVLRNFLPEHFMEPYALDKGLTVKRAIIFNHYPVLTDLFTYVDLEVPQEFLRPLGNAGKLFRKETARVKKTPAAAAAAKAIPAPIRIPQPLANEPSPAYAPITPPANQPSPAYAPITPKGGAKTRRTKKVSEIKKAHEYAALFKNIWNKLR